MEETDWDAYGVGNYEKCADCMVHSGFEATAVGDTVTRPWKALGVALLGVQDRRADGARYPARGSAPRGLCVRQERHAEAVRDPRRRGRGKGREEGDRNGLARRKAARLSRRRRAALRTGPASARAPRERRRRRPGRRIGGLATSGGRSRSAGSATARRIANGAPRSRAKRPAIRLSMSTAAAPVSAAKCAFRLAASTGRRRRRTVRAKPERPSRGVQPVGKPQPHRPDALAPDVDLHADNQIPGTQPTIESAAHAPTDHQVGPRPPDLRKPALQGRSVPANRDAAGARQDRGLALQPDRRRRTRD